MPFLLTSKATKAKYKHFIQASMHSPKNMHPVCASSHKAVLILIFLGIKKTALKISIFREYPEWNRLVITLSD